MFTRVIVEKRWFPSAHRLLSDGVVSTWENIVP